MSDRNSAMPTSHPDPAPNAPKPSPPNDLTSSIAGVLAALRAGSLADAEQLYRIGIERFPNQRFPDLAPGMQLLQAGLAWAALDFAIHRTSVTGPEAEGLRGRALLALDRPAEAEAFLRAALAPRRIFQESVELQEALAEVCDRLGQATEAGFWRRRARIMAENFCAPAIADYDRAFALRRNTRNPLRERATFWPLAFAADGNLTLKRADLRTFVERHIVAGLPRPTRFIRAEDRIFSFGSCFARNIAAALLDFNVVPFNATFFEDINTPVANQLFFEWLLGKRQADADENTRRMGILYGAERDRVIRNLAAADALIMTVGVGAVPFDTATGQFIFAPVFEDGAFDRIEMRTLSVAEHTACLQATVDSIRAFNPTAPLYVTLSPVPLNGTTEFPSTIIADCVSKSTLRTALAELLRTSGDNTFYWPAFEIIRWLGSHLEFAVFNNLDSRYPDREIIAEITDLFVQTFGDSSLVRLRPAIDTPRTP